MRALSLRDWWAGKESEIVSGEELLRTATSSGYGGGHPQPEDDRNVRSASWQEQGRGAKVEGGPFSSQSATPLYVENMTGALKFLEKLFLNKLQKKLI